MSSPMTSPEQMNSLISAPTLDALRPVSPRVSLAYVGNLPRFQGWGWKLRLLAVAATTMTIITLASALPGRIVDLLRGDSVTPFGAGSQAAIALVATVSVLFIADQIGRSILRYIFGSRARMLSIDLRQACLSATLRVPNPVLMSLGTGNVITRMTKDIDTCVNIVMAIAVRLVLALLTIPFTFIALSFISPWFLLLGIILLVIVVPTVRTSFRAMPVVADRASSAQARRNNVLLDTISGLGTIRALRMEKWALKRVEKSSWASVQAEVDRLPVNIRLLRDGQIAYGMLIVVGIAAAWLLNHLGVITLGEASAATILLSRIEMALFNLIFFGGEIQQASTSLGRAVALAQLGEKCKISRRESSSDQSLAAAPAKPPAEAAVAGDAENETTGRSAGSYPSIHINDVSFGYPGQQPIIEHLNLTLTGGTITALVGASGAGKSTLASLIAGLLEPTSGSIALDDVDLTEADEQWVATQVSLLSQEVHIFAGPLRNDLQLARPGASDQELLAALTQVGLGEGSASWARWFTAGLDTIVGASAAKLPPEIQQQIALARVLLIDPPVLIMDEATSEAGSQTARELERSAHEAAKGRTTLIVAHRLDQAIAADRILVMRQGVIIQDGTHEQLLSRPGDYAELYRRWSANHS